MAKLFGVAKSTIEFIKPTHIKKGLEITFHVYMNDTHTTQVDYAKALIEANAAGDLAEIIKHAWKLSGTPKISDIKSRIVDSKNQLRMKSTMSTMSITATNGDDITTKSNVEMQVVRHMEQQMFVREGLNEELEDATV